MRTDINRWSPALLIGAVIVVLSACGSSTSSQQNADVVDATLPPPTIIIEQPVDGSVVTSRNLVVRGRVDGRQTGEVTVNGVSVPLVDGRFEATTVLEQGAAVDLTVSHTTSGVSAKHTLYVDYTHPVLTIESPERGSRQKPPNDKLNISVKASDNLDLQELWQGTDKLETKPGQSVQREVTLKVGLNTFVFKAVDKAGNQSFKRISVLYGETRAPDVAIPGALRVHLGTVALGVIADVARSLFDGLDLQKMLIDANPIYTSSVVTLNLKSLKRELPSTFTLIPKTGLIAVNIAARKLEIVVEATLSQPVLVTIKADVVSFSGDLKVSLNQDNKVVVALENTAVAFNNLDVAVNDNGDLLNALPEYEKIVVDGVQKLLSGLVETEVMPLVNDYLKTIADDRTLKLGETELTIKIAPEWVNISPEGVGFRLGAAVALAVPPTGVESDGFLFTPGDSWSTVPVSQHLKVVLADDLVNLLLHEAWRAGLLSYTVDQAMLDRNKSEIELVAGFMGSIVELITPPVHPETPISIEVAAVLPPIFQIDPQLANGFKLRVGDYQIGVLTASGEARTLFSGYLTAGLTAGMQWLGDQLVLHPFELELAVDITSDNVPNVAAFENFTNLLVEPIGGMLNELLRPIALPQFTDVVRLSDLVVGVDGPNDDYLSLEIRLHPAPTEP